MTREDCARTSESKDSIIICAVLDAKEEIYVMMFDVLNSFIQTLMPKINYWEERFMMNITGVLVDMLV